MFSIGLQLKMNLGLVALSKSAVIRNLNIIGNVKFQRSVKIISIEVNDSGLIVNYL